MSNSIFIISNSMLGMIFFLVMMCAFFVYFSRVKRFSESRFMEYCYNKLRQQSYKHPMTYDDLLRDIRTSLMYYELAYEREHNVTVQIADDKQFIKNLAKKMLQDRLVIIHDNGIDA